MPHPNKKRVLAKNLQAADVAMQYGITLPSEPVNQTLSPNEAAVIFGVTGEAVKQWIFHKRLPATKIKNGFWRIKASDLEKFIKERNEGPQKQILAFGIPQNTVHYELLGQELKARIEGARSLSDAILKIHKNHPSIVIIGLTDNKGWALATEIRESHALRSVRILFLCETDLTKEELDRAVALQIDACLTGPLDRNALFEELKILMNR